MSFCSKTTTLLATIAFIFIQTQVNAKDFELWTENATLEQLSAEQLTAIETALFKAAEAYVHLGHCTGMKLLKTKATPMETPTAEPTEVVTEAPTSVSTDVSSEIATTAEEVTTPEATTESTSPEVTTEVTTPELTTESEKLYKWQFTYNAVEPDNSHLCAVTLGLIMATKPSQMVSEFNKATAGELHVKVGTAVKAQGAVITTPSPSISSAMGVLSKSVAVVGFGLLIFCM